MNICPSGPCVHCSMVAAAESSLPRATACKPCSSTSSCDSSWNVVASPSESDYRHNASITPSSHRWHRQDKTVLSCRWCEQNWRHVKTLFSSPHRISSGRNSFKIFCCRQCRQFCSHCRHGQGKTRRSCRCRQFELHLTSTSTSYHK